MQMRQLRNPRDIRVHGERFSAGSLSSDPVATLARRLAARRGLLVLGLSVLLGVTSIGCSVDTRNLNVVQQDAAVGREDARADAAVADSASSRDFGPREANPSDPSAKGDAASEGRGASDLRPSTDAGGTGAQVDGQPIPDGAPAIDAVPSVDVGASEVALSGDAADTAVAPPDVPTPIDVAPTIVNLSRGKPSTASAEQAGKEAIFGNDGDSKTSFCNANGTFPAWWRVDLGATFNLVRTEVVFEKPDYAYTYKIEISDDDATYTTVVDRSVASKRAESPASDSFTAQARYVRITMLGAIPPVGAWPCFGDFAVWGYASPGSSAAVLTNLAPSGTAYRWFGNTDDDSNSNRVAEPKLNDNSVADDISLAGTAFWDEKNTYEAAGVILPRASTLNSVVFVNGATLAPPPFIPGDPDGNFTRDFQLQFSTDGTTWSAAEGWTLTPAYPYDASASNRVFVFSGSATGVLGVRVTGLIRPDDTKSAYVRAREVQIWGPSGTAAP
jgi:hypothetical protein